jgi:hypothetical protein
MHVTIDIEIRGLESLVQRSMTKDKEFLKNHRISGYKRTPALPVKVITPCIMIPFNETYIPIKPGEDILDVFLLCAKGYVP